jgi:hypothetical protein
MSIEQDKIRVRNDRLYFNRLQAAAKRLGFIAAEVNEKSVLRALGIRYILRDTELSGVYICAESLSELESDIDHQRFLWEQVHGRAIGEGV